MSEDWAEADRMFLGKPCGHDLVGAYSGIVWLDYDPQVATC